MMAVPLTELGNIRKGTVQFGTLEFKCLEGLQVGHWMCRSRSQEELVGSPMYELMCCKYVIKPAGVDR